VTLHGRNVGRGPLPYASGFHPYISAGTSMVDECLLELPATTWLETVERQIPIARRPVAGTEHDFTQPRAVGAQRLDTAYTDLARNPDGFARVRLSAADGSGSVAVRLGRAYTHV